jgi:hypothetical protein
MLIEDLKLGYMVEFAKCYDKKCSCIFCENNTQRGIVRSVNFIYTPIEAELDIRGVFAANYKLSQSDLSDPHIVKAVCKPTNSYEKIKENIVNKNEDYK